MWLLAGGGSINIHLPSQAASQHNKSESWKCQWVEQAFVSAGCRLSLRSRQTEDRLTSSHTSAAASVEEALCRNRCRCGCVWRSPSGNLFALSWNTLSVPFCSLTVLTVVEKTAHGLGVRVNDRSTGSSSCC